MREVLRMSAQTTCGISPSVISSQESGCGPSPSGKPAGRMTGEYGQEVARASLSPRQAKERGFLTSGIFGQHSSTSSRSAALTSLLESKLKQQLSNLGSTLYKLTWKALVTPQGRSVPLLRASVLRTSGPESIGPGSPTSSSVVGWVTPTTRDWKDGAECLNVPINSLLGRMVWLAGWPTPQHHDAKMALSPVAMENWLSRANHGSELGATAYQVMGWATPSSQDAVRGVRPPRAHDTGVPLTQQAGQMDFGKMPTGCPSGIPSSAQLNPAHSRWLLGLPVTWDDAAPMEMP